MIKKMIMLAGVIALGVIAVRNTSFGKSVYEQYENIKVVVKSKKDTPERQLRELKQDVEKLEQDANRIKDDLAKEIVEARELQRTGAKLRTEIDAEQARVVAIGKEIESATKHVSYGRETLSVNEAKDRLKSDVSFIMRKKTTLATLEKTTTQRERAREILEKQLDEINRQKLTLKAEIEAIEVDYKALALQQMENKYQKDDTRLSQIKQTLDKLRKDLEVKQERMKLDPVGMEPAKSPSSESVDDILAPLTGSKKPTEKSAE